MLVQSIYHTVNTVNTRNNIILKLVKNIAFLHFFNYYSKDFENMHHFLTSEVDITIQIYNPFIAN